MRKNKIKALEHAIASGDRYGYDPALLHCVASQGILSTHQPSLFGLENFQEEIASEELLKQSLMEHKAIAAALGE